MFEILLSVVLAITVFIITEKDKKGSKLNSLFRKRS